MKPNARILDTTAGNRSIWQTKDDPRILYIDIESDLEVPPDEINDCTKTGYQTGRFHTIIFDPPHEYGILKGSSIHSSPNRDYFKPKWHLKKPAYYGPDKFKTKRALLVFIVKAGREIHRILQDDGCLWFKWGERCANVDAILPLFEGFQEMMRITVRKNSVRSNGSYWCLLMKRSTPGGKSDQELTEKC